MRDHDVRRALRRTLQETYANDPHTRIVEEMGVWSGSARIDVAVINGELSGFELKSDKDTLERLPFQVDLFSRVFDRVTLVVGERFRVKARGLIPDWWGLTVATFDPGSDPTVSLRDERSTAQNPSPDRYLLAQLLWKDEALELLRQRGADRGMRSKRVREIHMRLANVLPGDSLGASVRNALKRRQDWLRKL
jgi:hypothetical protein